VDNPERVSVLREKSAELDIHDTIVFNKNTGAGVIMPLHGINNVQGRRVFIVRVSFRVAV
jgi:hypothetical protein